MHFTGLHCISRVPHKLQDGLEKHVDNHLNQIDLACSARSRQQFLPTPNCSSGLRVCEHTRSGRQTTLGVGVRGLVARGISRHFSMQMHIAGHKVNARAALSHGWFSNRVHPARPAFSSLSTSPNSVHNTSISKRSLCGCLVPRTRSLSASRYIAKFDQAQKHALCIICCSVTIFLYLPLQSICYTWASSD